MTRTWTTLAAVLSLALVFAAVTLLALEGREVVVLRTFDAHGQARETRTWIADADGYAWIEAANPQRPFLLQIESQSRSGAAPRRHACTAAAPSCSLVPMDINASDGCSPQSTAGPIAGSACSPTHRDRWLFGWSAVGANETREGWRVALAVREVFDK